MSGEKVKGFYFNKLLVKAVDYAPYNTYTPDVRPQYAS
jgi:hypothetical protein